MIEDFSYCASSFLQYRCIADRDKTFKDGIIPSYYNDQPRDLYVNNSQELEETLHKQCESLPDGGRTALALSGGIDSAILAKFVPKGTVAYTFKCIVPGVEVIDETGIAKRYAEACGLEHRVVEIYWEDFEVLAPMLMKHKGAPMHSIETQIYKGAKFAKENGAEILVFGESADLNYGGLSGLLSREWLLGEFVDRYSYVKPYHVLRDPRLVLEPIFDVARQDGYVDVVKFCRGFFFREAMGSYSNACGCAGVELCAPYARTWLNAPLDIVRIRKGDGKYLVREVFHKLYPDFQIPVKTPMPRPMSEWLASWGGPQRSEFLPNCVNRLDGDQKWLVWALEKFMNIVEED